MLVCQLVELDKFCKVAKNEMDQAHPDVDSKTITTLKDSIKFSDYMITGILSFAKYILYVQSKQLGALALVALPTTLKLYASQRLHEAVGDLSSFINAEGEKDRKEE